MGVNLTKKTNIPKSKIGLHICVNIYTKLDIYICITGVPFYGYILNPFSNLGNKNVFIFYSSSINALVKYNHIGGVMVSVLPSRQ
jgi:hypothetical protein